MPVPLPRWSPSCQSGRRIRLPLGIGYPSSVPVGRGGGGLVVVGSGGVEARGGRDYVDARMRGRGRGLCVVEAGAWADAYAWGAGWKCET